MMKNKGKDFEKFIAHEIEEIGLGNANREKRSGGGLNKGDIRANLPFLIEAKDQKTIHILDWIEQAQKQAEIGNISSDKWALIFRNPNSPTEYPECYAVIDMWQFFELLKKDAEPKIKAPDRELKWALTALKNAISKVLKLLD
jgi:hypothetical protein